MQFSFSSVTQRMLYWTHLGVHLVWILYLHTFFIWKPSTYQNIRLQCTYKRAFQRSSKCNEYHISVQCSICVCCKRDLTGRVVVGLIKYKQVDWDGLVERLSRGVYCESFQVFIMSSFLTFLSSGLNFVGFWPFGFFFYRGYPSVFFF